MNKAFLVVRKVGVPVVDQNNDLVLSYWLTEDKKWTRSRFAAEIFPSYQAAKGAIEKITGGIKSYAVCEPVTGNTLLRIRKSKAKHKARKLFGLPLTTPDYMLADRFEEEGIMEEASLFRGKK
jgi:hypothetical protein